MANYRELFISQFLDQCHSVVIIYEEGTNCFYEALFEGECVGGAIDDRLKNKARVISIDVVRKLARKSEDSRADKYVDISEDNWQELLSR